MKKRIYLCSTALFFCIMLFCFAFFNTNQKPLVSVVLPTYNRENYLKRSLDSLLAQTFKNFEIIVVDDGSTDGTQNILKEYQKKFKQLKVITHTQNLGVASARNTGNKYAQGKYIAIMDSDDFAMPNFLKETVSFMEANPSVTIGIPNKNAYYAHQEDNFYNPTTEERNFPLYWIVNSNYFNNTGNIFNRNFVLKHNIQYNPKYVCGEDYDFWIQMILKGASVAKIPTKTHLVVFRIKGGLSKNKQECQKTENIVREQMYKNINYIYNKYSYDDCMVIKALLKKNPQMFFGEEGEIAKKECPSDTDVFIKLKHPSWIDYLIFNQDATKVFRKNNFDSAQILSFRPTNEITIKWDKWGTETFVYNKSYNLYILKEDKPD